MKCPRCDGTGKYGTLADVLANAPPSPCSLCAGTGIGPLTQEEAELAYDEAEAVPLSAERIREIVEYATGGWLRGTVGRVLTHHRSDGDYSAAARLTHDSPPDQELVTVELLEDFYCCSLGETFETQRYLFRPG